ncbi:YihY/virulence factor BrkB family protein [Nitriliruptoraceae bacterium ZYF776]|nr:YihY/virulence factor BrkB family protein [Profundirhabdus halotolerans]
MASAAAADRPAARRARPRQPGPVARTPPPRDRGLAVRAHRAPRVARRSTPPPERRARPDVGDLRSPPLTPPRPARREQVHRVPAIVAAISSWGLVADPATVTRQLTTLTAALPAEAATLLEDQMTAIASSDPGTLGTALALSVLLALWSASSGMAGLIEGINAAYDEVDRRAFPLKRGLALLLTLAGILRLLLALLAALGLATLYKLAPDRDQPRVRWVTWGATFATALWLLGSGAFTLYVDRAGTFGETYGAFAGIIILMLWLFLTAFVVLLGAEINAEVERQTVRDTTVGPPRPIGTRGAEAADTTPEQWATDHAEPPSRTRGGRA